ncbi:MAG: AraC family transcriptional regulator [Clostridiales bacterium]|nr:AraC family transcriptional regulator [Clostridiales bacterium]
MIRSKAFLPTDPCDCEQPDEGLELFDLAANEGDIRRYVAGSIPPHWHRELELFILLGGTAQAEIGGKVFRIETGGGCFINTGVLHSFTAAGGGHCPFRSFVFDAGIVGGMPGSVFDVRYVRPLLAEGPECLVFSRQKDNDPYFIPFEQAFQACREEEPGYELSVRAALSQILLFIGGKGQGTSVKRPAMIREDRVKQMLRWLDLHLGEEVSVGKIARSASVGERECHRLFRQYLRCGPMEYLNRCRVLAAAERLASTNEPVTNIAMQCGFATPSYFSKRFKQLTGCTPREYRTTAQESPAQKGVTESAAGSVCRQNKQPEDNPSG